MTLHRYWFRFDLSGVARPPGGMLLGCGVTAYSREDALAMMQALVFDGRELPPITDAIADVDVRTLDQGHVIPNMGVVTRRGIWFPRGYAPV